MSALPPDTPQPGGPPPGPDDARLAALEQAVAALRQEVAELRASRSVDAPLTYRDVRTPAARPGVARRFPTADLRTAARDWMTGLGVPELPADGGGIETLVGRYGAVAVGALVLLMGVGAFLTWAVATFTLAPATRVVLGGLGAAALAALGERLRRREGARRFGEVLLALALAVVHVDAWAAGPYLHLVSAEAALGVAAAASAALTAPAWRAGQQSLFVVGVGGALLAPFVSGAGDAHPLVRPVYGWLVLTTGLAALVHGSDARRPWRAAARLLAAGTAGYALAQFDVGAGRWCGRARGGLFQLPVLARDVPPAFALACAAGPLAVLLWRARDRRNTPGATDALLVQLVLAELTTATVVLWAAAGATAGETRSLIGYAVVATLAAQAVAALPAAARAGNAAWSDERRRRWAQLRMSPLVLAGLALPLATLGAALTALGGGARPAAAAIAALWSGLSATAVVVAWHGSRTDGPDPRLGPHLAAAGLASALIAIVWTNIHDALRLALLGGHAALTAAVFARVPGRSAVTGVDARPLLALAPPLVVLAGATVWDAALLADRPAFAYRPFLTAPSAGAAAVVGGWAVCAAVVWRAGDDLLPRAERAAVVAVAAGVALLWGRQELAGAVAPDMATFLLVGYFAVAGVATLALGRARRIAAARQAGLALALYAALKALVEVSQLDAVALRVGSYLLVGGFLLGVGYWYRGGEVSTG
ncbi:hypothetical protein tb265_13290 [Gemmatimonadetes bacterium T265]|nr:hypothetical protein tb265_13290 [Gemmatimonadetes bacterium T265]